jgi:hypothetical protein
MMSADIKKLQAQQEAQAMELQRLKMNQARQNQQPYYPQPDDDRRYTHQETVVDEPQYNTVDEQNAMIEAITQRVTQQVTNNVQAHQNAVKGVDNRMERLIKKYPGIQDDDHPITKQARDEYQRISKENPGLISTDKGAAYELAVETAASTLGIRPANQEYNPMQDYTLSANGNQNLSRRTSKSGNFLTPKILANFEVLAKNHPDFNMDPSTPQGKKNLEELNEYSERYRANVDESHIRYK